jgi:hypothetical protein
MGTFLRSIPFLVVVGTVALMSGLLSIIREGLLLYVPGTNQRSLFWACVRVAFIISALLALYGTWDRARDLQTQLTEANERSVPKLSLQIDRFGMGIIGPIHPAVAAIVWAAVGNSPTGASSIAEDWALEITDPATGKIYRTRNEVPPKSMKFKQFEMASDPLYEKAMAPIIPGAKIRGMLLFYLPDVKVEEEAKLPKPLNIVLKCHDISGTVITAQMTYSGIKDDPFQYLPGTTMPTQKGK